MRARLHKTKHATLADLAISCAFLMRAKGDRPSERERELKPALEVGDCGHAVETETVPSLLAILFFFWGGVPGTKEANAAPLFFWGGGGNGLDAAAVPTAGTEALPLGHVAEPGLPDVACPTSRETYHTKDLNHPRQLFPGDYKLQMFRESSAEVSGPKVYYPRPRCKPLCVGVGLRLAVIPEAKTFKAPFGDAFAVGAAVSTLSHNKSHYDVRRARLDRARACGLHVLLAPGKRERQTGII